MTSPTVEMLRIAGEALYGQRWQSRLARDLGMSDRNLRYMMAGTHAGAFELPEQLASILQERAQALLGAAGEIEALARAVRDHALARTRREGTGI
jgi:hypothetical protein